MTYKVSGASEQWADQPPTYIETAADSSPNLLGWSRYIADASRRWRPEGGFVRGIFLRVALTSHSALIVDIGKDVVLRHEKPY